jgi:ergothioneine biosynthesis protein EgtB
LKETGYIVHLDNTGIALSFRLMADLKSSRWSQTIPVIPRLGEPHLPEAVLGIYNQGLGPESKNPAREQGNQPVRYQIGEVKAPSMSWSRDDAISAYKHVRTRSEDICRPLAIEDYVVQPVEDVSPPKWHLGHTTWFFEQVLLDQFQSGYERFHSKYFYLFNSYYQSFGDRWNRPQRGTLSRPTVKDVTDYRAEIDRRMTDFIGNVKEEDWPRVCDLIILGLNHEQQHQELLLTDIKFILATSPLNPVYAKNDHSTIDRIPDASFIEFSGGIFDLGCDGKNGFCYDNETPNHRVFVEDFRLMNRLVTCGEFLEFMSDGGYEKPTLWLSDGWDWLAQTGRNKPLFWETIDGEWHLMTLSGLQKIDPNEPVCHVTYFEAAAFARWREARLPTEAEWELAAQSVEATPGSGNFYEDGHFHPIPCRLETESNGLYQMFGDVWEWTGSAYLAYPGYIQAEGALGEYNGKFMNNQMVLRGGSCATPRDHIRATYRNFFQSDKDWQFTGFRLATDA